MKHHREQIDEEKTGPETGGRDCRQQHENSRRNRPCHPQKTGQFMSFINMAQAGNDAQEHSHRIARFAFRGFRFLARPIAATALLRAFGQQVAAIRTRHRVRAASLLLRRCVGVLHVD